MDSNRIKSLSDAATENEVLGYLLKQPSLLLEPDFSLSADDFTNQRNKLVYAVLANMAHQGAETITPYDIDTELKNYPMQYEKYNSAGGVEGILSFALDDDKIVDKTVFNILYTRLKKYSVLRDLEKTGISTQEFYNNDCFDNSNIKEKFENSSIEDFIKSIKDKVNDIEEKYQAHQTDKGISAADGLKELIEAYKLTPAIGATLDGELYNYVVRGARLGKMYLTSSPSGHGKTRRMVGQACALSLPFLTVDGKIVVKDEYYPALFISTEQSVQEIQTLVLAYVSNVREDKITDGMINCSEAERKRIEIAIQIIELFKDNLMLEQIPDPSIGLVKSKILRHIYKKNVRYVFYDYIFTSPGLIAEFAAARLREDVVLLMMSNALKEIATMYDVFVMSATQMSGDYDKPCFRGMGFIRGSKAIADKIDVGSCTVRLLPAELDEIKAIIEVLGEKPNIVSDIYKNRSGMYTQVKIFSYFDYGTCHISNCFMTDLNYIAIELDQSIKFVQKTEMIDDIEELKQRKEKDYVC